MTTVGTITYYEPMEGINWPITRERREPACNAEGCVLLARLKEDGSAHVDHVTPGVRSATRVFDAEDVDPETHEIKPRILRAWIRECHASSDEKVTE